MATCRSSSSRRLPVLAPRLYGLQRLLRTLVLLLLATLPACGTQPGVIFPPIANAPAWPPPPDAARITYVGKLVTSADLKPCTSGLDALGQALFGKKDTHSMLSPIAVCSDGAPGGGRIFVADSNAQCVHVFDLQTRLYTRWQPPKGKEPFAQPVALAWDPARSRLLVSDSVAAAVLVFNSTGQYLGRFGAGAGGGAEAEALFQRPVGIAVNFFHNRILVADAKAHQIVVLGLDGQLLQRLGSRGTGPGEFNFPTNIAVDPAGLVYVSDSLNFRIQQFDADLHFLRTIGKKGDLPGYFAQPKGIAIDTEGHLYVVDSQFENIQVFDNQGRILMDFGDEGSAPGQFWLPNGIFISPLQGAPGVDRILVADSYNRRLQVFDYKPVQEVKP